MYIDLALKAVAHFAHGTPQLRLMDDGFIRCDFADTTNPSLILQCINPRTIPLPENITGNYLRMKEFLQSHHTSIKMASLVATHQQKLYWVDEEENFWLAFGIPASYDHYKTARDPDMAFQTAAFYAGITRSLSGLDSDSISEVVPGHHNLYLAFEHLEDAIGEGAIMRLLRATHVISELRQRRYLLRFVDAMQNEESFPTRTMMNNAGTNNLLFAPGTGEPVLLFNIQRLMAGKFFSDPGELLRTTCSPVDEDSTDWEQITVRPAFYEAVYNGYLAGAGGQLSDAEIKHFHYAGLLVTCYQCLRFTTDFIRNDIYFQTTYAEQNLNRALNQLILLESMEAFVATNYHFHAGG